MLNGQDGPLTCAACGAEWPATQRFCGECGSPLGAPAVAEPELRLLTILFCDLVGSTELSTRLDPEDLSDVIRSFHQVCESVIVGAGGHVVKFIGDGVLACSLLRGDISHDPWQVQQVDATIRTNTLLDAVGLKLSTTR